MVKPTKPRDPHLAHVVCLNKKCKAVYDVKPTPWTPEGGYYSSDRDFCKKCGGDNIDVSYAWLVKKTKALLVRMRKRIDKLTHDEARSFVHDLFNVLWNPPDKEWNSNTFNEIVMVFQHHDLIPDGEDMT